MKTPTVLLVNPPSLLDKPDCGQAGILFLSENLKVTAMNPGLLSIATYLDSKGIPVAICDLSLSEDFNDLRKIIRDVEPDIIGVSSTSAIDYMEALECLKIAAEERPQAIRVAGGQHIGMLEKLAFKDSPHLQVLARYEGEVVMEQITSCVKDNLSFSGIEGIIVRNSDGKIFENKAKSPFVDLDDIPPLHYELYPDYKKFTPFIEESRGCSFGCEYCTSRFINDKKIRYKDPNHFEKELEHAMELWGKEPIYAILSSNFGIRSGYTNQLVEIFKSAGIKWNTEFRADCNWEKYLHPLYESGLKILSVGMESASPEILKRMLKTQNPQRYLDKTSSLISEVAKMPNMILRINVIFYVGETPKTLRETITFLATHSGGIDSIVYTPVLITPGTLLSKNFKHYEKELGASFIESSYWDKRRLGFCNPSKYFSFKEAVCICDILEKVFSTPEGWSVSRSQHYNQNQEKLKETLINGRFSATSY